MLFQRIKQLIPFRQTSFEAYARLQSERAYAEGGYSRAANYLTAARQLTRAVGHIALRQLTAERMEAFQRYMKANGISLNTMSCYNRSLRAIYNKAVAEGLVSDCRPFDKVFTGKVKTAKRSVGEEVIARLLAIDLSANRQLAETRDYFIFSFCAMGMPFVDMAYLRKSQVTGDMLVYDRHKTGTTIRVPLCAMALDIIARYEARSLHYVFPILTSTTEPAAYEEYCLRLNEYNRRLKHLATMAGITDNLTSYTMRHSWASMAYKSDVPLHAISQALGHTRPDTTMIYIRELDDGLMRQQNDKVQQRVTDQTHIQEAPQVLPSASLGELSGEP